MLLALAPRALHKLIGAPMCAASATNPSSNRCRLLTASTGCPPSPPTSAGSAATQEERAASLPVEQLAKALLAGNARAQLTTATAGLTASEESKVTSSVAPYLLPRGEAPVVLLSKQDRHHLVNLGENAKASLATGHIGPSWFIQRLRATGWLPRRIALLGSLHPLPASELRFAWGQAQKACKAVPSLAALLPGEEQLPEFVGFRLERISQCVYVDAAGRQHAVVPAELDGAFVDPLAPSQHDILAAINQDPQWQLQLQLFAAAYLGVGTSQVLLTEADRLGFTLLGAPLSATVDEKLGTGGQTQQQQGQAGQQQRWRQFRIGSSRELRDREAFMALLEQMKHEVQAAAAAH